MLKDLPDWQTAEVASIFDEVTLWSAPFGRLLLENIPLKKAATILDIGFGTGFPLVELGQITDRNSRVIGMDIWEAGMARAKEKLQVLGLEKVEIMPQSASEIPLADGSVDLVTSNLGINNFDAKERVYAEIFRVLKPEGSLCLTTNPVGTFAEFFKLFLDECESQGLPESAGKMRADIARRRTRVEILDEFEQAGFVLKNEKSDATFLRFLSGEALLNHSLIRIGFRASWEAMVPEHRRNAFFTGLAARIDEIVATAGVFRMRIPMLYLELGKGGG